MHINTYASKISNLFHNVQTNIYIYRITLFLRFFFFDRTLVRQKHGHSYSCCYIYEVIFQAWQNHNPEKLRQENAHQSSPLVGRFWPLWFKQNSNIQSATGSHLVESHPVHLSTEWKTRCARYMTGHPVWICTCLGEEGKENTDPLLVLYLTAGVWPVPCLLWFTLLKAVYIYFLTFVGHFGCGPACSPLFLELPLFACTPGFFWPPQLSQQYKAWLA